MNYNRAKMKQDVKQLMRQTRPRPIWVTLLYMIIVAAGGWLIQTILGAIMGASSLPALFGNTYLDALLYGDVDAAVHQIVTYLLQNASIISGIISGSVLISILSYLWNSTMAAGYVGYSLRMVRGQSPNIGSLFSAFPRFGRVLLTNILVGIFTLLWGLLFTVGLVIVVVVAALLMGTAMVVSVILLIAAYVAYIVAILWVTYRFALTNYLVMDQGISGLEALNVSKQLMRGNKRRLFVLQLSFIGWYLLEIVIVWACVLVMVLAGTMMAGGVMGGIIAGVILMLVMLLVIVVAMLLFNMWLTPYVSGATVKFYEYTMSQRPDLFRKEPGTTTYTDDSFGNPNYPTLD